MDNPIESLKNETLNSNLGFRDMTNSTLSIKPIKLARYYEAEKKLIKYDQAVTLFGIRRTGKTVVLEQLLNEFKTSKSMYLVITDNCPIDNIYKYLRGKVVDYLFIDEVTRIFNIENEIHIILDYCATVGIKVVLSGTSSYLIKLALRDSALGRLSLVKFVPTLYEDICKLHANTTFMDFYEKAITLGVGDVFEDLIFTVSSSIVKSYKASKNPLYSCSNREYGLALQTITEYIIGTISDKIEHPKYEMYFSSYTINETDVNSFNGLMPSQVQELYSILRQIGVIQVVPRVDLITGDSTVMFYMAVPVMYHSVLSNKISVKYLNGIGIDNTMLSGLLFESVAVSQILAKLEGSSLSPDIFSIRRAGGEYEIDLCVRVQTRSKYVEDDTDVLTMIEFKRNQSKFGKHFYHPDIEEYCKQFTKVNKYTVYARKTKEIDDNPQKVYIEDFLANLEEYIR